MFVLLEVNKLILQPILIQDLSLANSSDDSIENGNDAGRILRIQDKDKNTLVLLTATVSDCNLWLKEIENARKAINNIKSSLLNRPKSSKYSQFLFVDCCFCNLALK